MWCHGDAGLNTIGKQEAISRIISWAKEKSGSIGALGEWQHYNSNVVVDLAIKKANMISGITDIGM